MTSPAAKMCGTTVRNSVVDLHATAVVGREAGVLERERVGRAGASDREQRHVGDDALARLEQQHGASRRPLVTSQALDRLTEAKIHIPLSHLVNQLVDDLGVDELERPIAAIDDRDLDAERREHRRVLDADDAGADDREGAGKPLHASDVVARDDRLTVGRDSGRRHRRGSGRDEDRSRTRSRATRRRRRDANAMRIDERRFAAKDVDAVARELIRDDRRFARPNLVDARQQFGRRRSPLRRVRRGCGAGGRARRGEPHDRFAKRLARNRAAVDADPAESSAPLDQRDAASELCGLHGAALSSRPAANADEVVVEGIAHRSRIAHNERLSSTVTQSLRTASTGSTGVALGPLALSHHADTRRSTASCDLSDST